ncbi:MAG TPA: response regulator [Bacteroidales bacterium]|nr:response regulator [Bacteroidales bacterium]
MKQLDTILVIDDSSTNVVLIEAVLNNKGYQIATALSVKEAYALMDKHKPKLILLDLLMPRINGFDFLKEIKENKNFQDIPVIVVSALTDIETINKTKELGAVGFIKKPIDIHQLLELVENIFVKK